MSKKDKKNKKEIAPELSTPSINPRIQKIILAIVLVALSIVIILGGFGAAGIAGRFLYHTILESLFGFGVVLVPIFLIFYAIQMFKREDLSLSFVEYGSSFLLLLSVLGFIQIVSPEIRGGGLVGFWVGSFITHVFDVYAGGTILAALAIISILILINEEINLPHFFSNLFAKKEINADDMRFLSKEALNEMPDVQSPSPIKEVPIVLPKEDSGTTQSTEEVRPKPIAKKTKDGDFEDEENFAVGTRPFSETYNFPPLDLLGRTSGKPSVGDIKANANLIKRTLLNFGIDVEMDEVSIGPTVTRYALKPAEGIKLTRILGLKSDLALALAAHPIRIEAPIPGKSLVGIEIPNKTKESVGLGNLLEEKAYQESPKRLLVALGKTVSGKSHFADLGKMPHLLVAGTTGSGKSVTVHNFILSLLYRNGPEDLRFIMVDPKRVELTLYNNIPHLLTPVIKEPKKAILALKWAAKEMERRYDILEKNGCRDIESYRKKIADHIEADRMPYIVIIIDELADIMQAYPRELEAAIVRLAQMSRATGIHLILSTQRPSVNVITGLIKANIPARLALQVASQIDSRTILDAPGAESLLGQGDMLYQGEGMSKPERVQCGNVSESEIKSVVTYIKKHNEGIIPDEISLGETLDEDKSIVSTSFGDSDDEDDELYEEARACVMEAGKASTSYIQRKLKVGYSRAARLIDLLEERGVVGPADGAKPREVIGARSSGLSTDTEPNGFDPNPEV